MAETGLRDDVPDRYDDPLDVIWLATAAKMGMTIKRDPDVFASWDGHGTLRIGVAESLDEDDCLAQMILHESCHALVEGPQAWQLPDWGLRIDDPTQKVREYACLRLQAAIVTPFGLRQFFAATTSFRTYYDGLPPDPLSVSKDPAVEIALKGWQRFEDSDWKTHLANALRATAALATVTRPFAAADSLWSKDEQADRSSAHDASPA